jgi:hypothetical protein
MPLRVPATQRRHRILIQVGLVVAELKAVPPQQPLQRLERGVLAIGVDPALQRRHDVLVTGFGGKLAADLLKPALRLGLVAVIPYPRRQLPSRIGKQHRPNKRDRSNSPFNVKQNRGLHGRIQRRVHWAGPLS